MATVHLERRFQGPTERGQGGWTAHRFQRLIGEPVTLSLRAPVPLETDLVLVEQIDGWELVDPSGSEPVTVMTASPGLGDLPDAAPVTLDEAIEGRARFEYDGDHHPVPRCFSCGLQHDSMRVHGGPIGGDRYATDWTIPGWAADGGEVDSGALWAAIDCAAAWYVCGSRGYKLSYTVQLAVEQLQPLEPGATYALVGWSGDGSAEWDGRKRHGASAAFAADGTLVARSRSFWVAPR
ncbi:MAG: hypothetical protein AAGD18_15530 [Actinomycetota bacterium]